MASKAEIIEEINDDNLYLRKVSKSDIEFFFRSLNERELTSYLSLGPLRTIEHAKGLIKNYLGYWNNLIQFNYIIELHEYEIIKIGSISLWNVSWQHLRAQIGIWLLPSFWGRGFGEKSLNLIKKVGFYHLELNRLEAYIALDNKRSLSLFEKCDFKKEGVLNQYLNLQGDYHNAIIVALLKDEFT